MNNIFELRKILISEDLESIAKGLEKVLHHIANVEITHTRYCDDAWLKLKKAQIEHQPFDLLITDLSFKPDQREVELKGGEDLINAIRMDDISCKIIVFSIEDKPLKIKQLFKKYDIDGYVVKGRTDHSEFEKAFRALSIGEKYTSKDVKQQIHLNKSFSQVEPIDLMIVEALCKGKTQSEISIMLQKENIKASSTSSIEKRLKNLREEFSAKTNIELALIFKELGLV